METIPGPEAMARQLLDLMMTLGRKNSLRDPLVQAVEALGFTPPQLHAVIWLGADGPLTMGELAQRVGVTEKTITGIVDRLEGRGFVQRERDLVDRRVVRVRHTAEGALAYTEFDQQIFARTVAFLSILAADDAAVLLRIVERMVERVSQTAPQEVSAR